MSLDKAGSKAVEDNRNYRPLIEDGGYFVPVSHLELDSLIGRLCQLFELNGDVEQRNALKSETKQRCRDWLDAQYIESGYDKWTGLAKGVVPHKISK